MDRLIKIFHTCGAVRRGDFVLKSGKRSDLYLDVKKVSLFQTGLLLLTESLYAHLLNRFSPLPHLAGKAEGVNNLLGGLLFLTAQNNEEPPLHSLLLRPQAKAHGVDPGSGILTSADLTVRHAWVVLEDVTTTGHSALEVVRLLRSHNQDVWAVVAVVDRQEGADVTLAEAGVDFRPLLTRQDLLGE
jgi:orotate phosphoribosyltransferase